MGPASVENNHIEFMERSLIVSYSYSGNTHRIAERIRTMTGGDWCEIYPWQPYPMASWINQNDLSGKIILPFYSHCGGAAGDFQENIVKRCPKADVREALSVIDGGGKSLGEILQSWMARNGIRVFQTV